MSETVRPVGDLLREWRQRRRLSQMSLALDAEISPRHLSFLETGRAAPSRAMVLRLAEQLDVPLRERNTLLLAAGYAPMYRERGLDDPALEVARNAIAQVLAAHMPFPALAIDRHWTLVAANDGLSRLMEGVAPELLVPPVNVLRASLHPQGLAPRIANLAECRAHLLARLGRQIGATGDPVLVALRQELAGYPTPEDAAEGEDPDPAAVAVPIRIHSQAGLLSFISTTTVFGTPVDITLSELAVEALLPADAATGEALRAMAAA